MSGARSQSDNGRVPTEVVGHGCALLEKSNVHLPVQDEIRQSLGRTSSLPEVPVVTRT